MAFCVGVKYAHSLNSASLRKGPDSPVFEYVMSSWSFSNEYDTAEWGMIWRLALEVKYISLLRGKQAVLL